MKKQIIDSVKGILLLYAMVLVLEIRTGDFSAGQLAIRFLAAFFCQMAVRDFG